MKLRSVLLIGLPVLLLALLFHAPVAILQGWFQAKDQPAPAELYGLEGSIAQGRVDGVVTGGRTVLADLRWRLRPLPLLLGRLGLTLNAGKEPILFDGQASVSLLGTLRLSEFRANAGLRPLLRAVGYPFLPIDGQAGLDFSKLVAVGRQLKSAEGNVQLQGLAWVLGQNPTPLGDFRADVTTEGGDIVARLASVSGPLELSGDARLLPDQSYELQIRLKPKPGAPPMLQNMLVQLGAPDAQGYYQIRRNGTLAPAQPAAP